MFPEKWLTMQDPKVSEELERYERFEAVFRSNFSRTRAFIQKALKDKEEAEDLSQDIFAKLWADKELFNNIQHVDGYLFQMARNRIYDYLEQKYAKNKHRQEWQNVTVKTGDEVLDQVIARDTELIFQMAIDRMPQQRRLIFRMSRLEGLSNLEIADRLHISKRTVDAHLYQALAELKKVAYLILFLLPQ